MALRRSSSTATWATCPTHWSTSWPSSAGRRKRSGIFSRDELIEQFTLDRVAKNPAVFDIEKLNWINFHYMKQLDEDQLYAVCLPHLQKAGYAQRKTRTKRKLPG